MNYIIFDMEWNQAFCAAKMVRSPVLLHGEIIQIGAVKTDENFNFLDKIKINIRPKFYKQMNPHVRKITGITDVQLTAGETFPQAFKRFSEWCGENFRFITWGFDDVGVLSDNLTLHGLDPSFGSNYINLQLIYNRQVKSEHLQCALSAAAEKLGIPLDVQVHDAMNDAYLTYEVCQKLDMQLGIAEYAEYTAAAAPQLFKDAVNGVSDPRKMLFDKRVTDLKCPHCGQKLPFSEWLFGNGKSCRTVTRCACGEFVTVKLKAVTIAENDNTVIRTIHAASQKELDEFAAKLAKREERRKKVAAMRKKAENKEGKEDKENNGAKEKIDDNNGDD